MKETHSILLTIDVEDWFQVENFKPWIPFSTWPSRELRVEKNTNRLLDLFDSFPSTRNSKPLPNKTYKSNSETDLSGASNPTNTTISINTPKATFFVLGWLAKRFPHLVREIHSRGHEVASHGYYHEICNKQSLESLKRDLSDSKKLLEDIIGASVYGYRAPSFAVNNEMLKIIGEAGYFYDSSYNSFDMHERYGRVDLSWNSQKGIAIKISGDFYELPISNLKLRNSFFPLGGGGYFRIIPFPLFKIGIKSILKNEKAYLFYMHPWEIDPQQPKVTQASAFYKFRHYVNIKKTYSKLSMLMKRFSRCNFIKCHQYLEEKVAQNF